MKQYDEQMSVSNERLLIPIKVNGKVVYFLIDTGASVALVDIKQIDKLKFKLGRKLASGLVGAGGEISEVYHTKDLDVDLNGHKMFQFVATDISSVKESIKRETDYEIFGILGLQQMKQVGMIIDVFENKVYFNQKA